MRDEELRELKAAVFGREAAQLPDAERAELEWRLAVTLAARADAARADAAGESAAVGSGQPESAGRAQVESEAAPAGEAPVASAPSSHPERAGEGAPTRRLSGRALALAAAAAGATVVIGFGAAQFAEQRRDSLAVFEAAPTAADAAAPRWFGLEDEAEFRALGEAAGHRIFAALRSVPVDVVRVPITEARRAPGTEPSDAIFLQPSDVDEVPVTVTDEQVCLFAVHDTGSAGTCVAMARFMTEGISLEVPGSSQLVRFAWGPQGPVRVEDPPAREL